MTEIKKLPRTTEIMLESLKSQYEEVKDADNLNVNKKITEGIKRCPICLIS